MRTLTPQASRVGSKSCPPGHGWLRHVGRGDGQVHGASTTLRRVHDLEVLDVDPALAEHSRELRQGAGPVRHDDLEDGHPRTHRGLGRQAQASALGERRRALDVAPRYPASRSIARSAQTVPM